MHERGGGPADRPPLVLVHGLGVSSRYLVPVAERLASTHRVYLPDLPDDVHDVPGRRRVLSSWMAAAGLERASFLANSLGCQIVVDLAVAEPDRVERLVLVGPTADPTAPLARQLLRLVAVAPFERPSLLPLVVAQYGAHPLRALRTARGMLADPVEEKLPRVGAPVLVVRGRHDRIVPQGWAEEVARLAGAELRVLRGGHALNYSSPDELARVTEAFLR
jgi:2-hydroxy-6-oxonona-2,4-dienedioate hydrolase